MGMTADSDEGKSSQSLGCETGCVYSWLLEMLVQFIKLIHLKCGSV